MDHIIIRETTATTNNRHTLYVALCPETIDSVTDPSCVSARYQQLLIYPDKPEKNIYKLTSIKPWQQTDFVSPDTFMQVGKDGLQHLIDRVPALDRQWESLVLRPAELMAQKVSLALPVSRPPMLADSTPRIVSQVASAQFCEEPVSLWQASADHYTQQSAAIDRLTLTWKQRFELPAAGSSVPFGDSIKTVTFVVTTPESLVTIMNQFENDS